MADKPLVVVDPHRRRMDEIFSASDLARLHRTVQVVWGRDEPMPLDEARAAPKLAQRLRLRAGHSPGHDPPASISR